MKGVIFAVSATGADFIHDPVMVKFPLGEHLTLRSLRAAAEETVEKERLLELPYLGFMLAVYRKDQIVGQAVPEEQWLRLSLAPKGGVLCEVRSVSSSPTRTR